MIEESDTNKRQSLHLYTGQYSYEPLMRIDLISNKEEHIYYFHTYLGIPKELTDEAVRPSKNAHISYEVNRYRELLKERYNRTGGIRDSI